MADALHPQTLLTWGMNGGDLPVPFGGPLRIAGASAAWLQEPEVCHEVDGHRQPEEVWLGSWLDGTGLWVFVVCGYLMGCSRLRHICS